MRDGLPIVRSFQDLGSARDGYWGAYLVGPRSCCSRRSRYPADFAGSVPEALAWHQREAEACLREKNGPAALFHLLHSGWK